MANALVSIALGKLTDVVGQQLSLFAGATRELENLSRTFRSIQAVLDDAESRQVGEKHVQLWLSRVRHAAYDIEDLLEDRRISGLGDQQGNGDDRNIRNKVCECLALPYNRSDHAVSRYMVARDIKEIREKLDHIADEKNMFSFSSNLVSGVHSMHVRSQRQTTSLVDKSEMVIGRESDKETMISKLVSGRSNEDGEQQVHVVGIIGVGGLGKTTLAQQIYHDGRVQDHFNMAVFWVCVSDVFDVIRLTKAILEQVKGTNNFPSELDALQKELLEALRGKRFLLVLDDVWNDDEDKWKTLWLPLNGGAQESRILITTRSQKVANTMNATFIHELKGLSDDDSWELFRSRAFAGRKAEEHLELENVGRKIVTKCKGVPLFIKVIGSAMYSKKTVEDWRNVLDSKIWSLPQVTDKILPALLLSYCNLPTHLKPCFAYCSIFPKDWQLEKDTLVRLWVVQGFIQSEGNREKEDIGDDYFDELVAWSMFQEIKENCQGKIICKMHDLLHDLAEFISKDEIYTFIGNNKGEKLEEFNGSSSNVRHAFLSFADSDDKPRKILIPARGAKKLRTLWLDGTVDGGITSVTDGLIHQARFLRALYFPSSARLPKSFGKLNHLRYLHLPRSKIVKLPESIGCLRNLHTLNLSNCYYLKKLPRGIGGMLSLRHLEIEGTNKLTYLPKGLGRISGLRSLSKFIVGGTRGCRINELQGLNSLHGSLQIEHLERVSSREEAEKAQLWNKPHLRRLVLRMSKGRGGDAETERMDSVLEGLRPNGNLEELELYCQNVSKLPSWMGQEGALEHLHLNSCNKLKSLPEGLGQLKKLKSLGIYELKALTCLPDSLGWLKSLERLEISYCKKLESLPQSFGQLKALNHLEIRCCKALGSLPHGLQHLSLLRELEIYDCRRLLKRCKRERGEDWPKISHIPKIYINGKLIIR